VHSVSELSSAGQKPWLLASGLKRISFLGQAKVQRAHALHRSRLTTILPMKISFGTQIHPVKFLRSNRVSAEHEDDQFEKFYLADISIWLFHNVPCLLLWRQEESGLGSGHFEGIGV
jgi:hypothetical protein